jgi:hypothetical protein
MRRGAKVGSAGWAAEAAPEDLLVHAIPLRSKVSATRELMRGWKVSMGRWLHNRRGWQTILARGTPLARFLKEEPAWTRLMARRAEGEKEARVREMTARLGRVGGNWVCVVAASNSPFAAAFALETSD